MGAGYRAFVYAGLAVIVASIVLTNLGASDPDSQVGLYVPMVVIGTFLLILVGILVRAVLWPSASDASTPGQALGGGVPRTAAAYRRELAILPVPSESPELPFAARWLVGIGALAAVLVVVCMGAYAAGWDAEWRPAGGDGGGIPIAALPILGTLAIGVLGIPFAFRSSRAAGDDWLAPLGLGVARMPLPIPVPRSDGSIGQQIYGTTTIEGERHGRRVVIDARGDRSWTRLLVAVPPFSLEERDGMLVASAPGPVAEALDTLEAHDRWPRVKAEGGAEGILVERRGHTDVANPGWLADLWLAEHLADAISARPAAA